jgi:cation:H+ antiporter
MLILYTGYKLSYYGDIICEKTSLTKSLMGFVFLSIATTLPEFVTSIGSITVVNSPNLAAGNTLGSILINLMIIALLDLVQGKGALLYKVSMNHILSGGLCIIALGFISFFIFLRSQLNIQLGLLNFGFDSLILFFIYVVGLRLMFGYKGKEKSRDKQKANPSSSYPHIRLKPTLIKFSLCFIAIIFLALWLAKVGEEIVKVMGWSEALVGTFFLALATSLPELVVSLTSLKFALDMAIGNILGANFLNVMTLPVCDIFFRRGQILSYVSPVHLITLSLGIILTAIVIIGIIYRSGKSFLRLGWDAIAMIATFVLGSYFLILFSGG